MKQYKPFFIRFSEFSGFANYQVSDLQNSDLERCAFQQLQISQRKVETDCMSALFFKDY